MSDTTSTTPHRSAADLREVCEWLKRCPQLLRDWPATLPDDPAALLETWNVAFQYFSDPTLMGGVVREFGPTCSKMLEQIQQRLAQRLQQGDNLADPVIVLDQVRPAVSAMTLRMGINTPTVYMLDYELAKPIVGRWFGHQEALSGIGRGNALYLVLGKADSLRPALPFYLVSAVRAETAKYKQEWEAYAYKHDANRLPSWVGAADAKAVSQ